MSPHMYGGIGGIVPVVAVLVAGEGEPLMAYVVAFPDSYKLVGYLIKIVGLFAIGYFWVRLNAEQNELKAFQLGIAAPAIITGMIASYDKAPPAKRVTFEVVGAAHASSETFEMPQQTAFLRDIVGGIFNESVVDDLPIERLPELFAGPERRVASDRLIDLYPQNREKVVGAVINAIKSESSAAYRTNIYVARTLGNVPGGWEGTEQQRKAVEDLRGQRSYQDVTFKENVERAISNWKLRTAS